LSLATGIPAAELLDFVSRSKSADDWGTLIDSSQAAEVNRIRSRYSADFVWTRPAKEREYALGEYFAPVVGFVVKGEGRTGIERWMNHALKGREGSVAGVKDGDGRFLPWLMRKTNSRPALDGDDVVLTIDPDLQIAAMESVARATAMHRADHGVAIVMDPQTGDVLALATAPSFDPEDPFPAFADFASGKRSSPEINPAVSFMFEPGSIFKMFTIALGLEAGVIKNGETITCSGTKDFSVKTMSCAGDSGPKAHGVVGVTKCLVVSCNISAATWGVRIGFDRYYATVEKLGLLQASGISLSPEARGVMRKNDANRTIQMANVGFGQSITGTPVGLASAFTCFANDGVRVAPRLVKRIGETEQPRSDSTRVFSREVANQLLEMSEEVVHSPAGTGYSLRIPGYTLAGKTGTAQKRDPKTGLVRSGMYISSFVGYFPAKNPRAVVLVMIDNPKSGHYYGGRVAGPVYQEIVQSLIRKWKVPPDRPTEAVNAAQ
jgi:cell division protein FtsI/penicillin-binding protein 2